MDGCDPRYPTEWREVDAGSWSYCAVTSVHSSASVPDVTVYYTMSEEGGDRWENEGDPTDMEVLDVKADRAGTSELPAGLDHTVPQHEASPRVPVAVAAVAEWVWHSPLRGSA